MSTGKKTTSAGKPWPPVDIWAINGRSIKRIHKLLCDIEDTGCPQMKKPVAEIRRLLQG